MKKKILLHPPTLGLKEKRYLINTVSESMTGGRIQRLKQQMF